MISERRKDLIAEKLSLEERKVGIQKDLQQNDPQSIRRLQQRKQRLANPASTITLWQRCGNVVATFAQHNVGTTFVQRSNKF